MGQIEPENVLPLAALVTGGRGAGVRVETGTEHWVGRALHTPEGCLRPPFVFVITTHPPAWTEPRHLSLAAGQGKFEVQTGSSLRGIHRPEERVTHTGAGTSGPTGLGG